MLVTVQAGSTDENSCNHSFKHIQTSNDRMKPNLCQRFPGILSPFARIVPTYIIGGHPVRGYAGPIHPVIRHHRAQPGLRASQALFHEARTAINLRISPFRLRPVRYPSGILVALVILVLANRGSQEVDGVDPSLCSMNGQECAPWPDLPRALVGFRLTFLCTGYEVGQTSDVGCFPVATLVRAESRSISSSSL